MKVRLGWWNTSLAPRGLDAPTNDQARKVALDVISSLINEQDVQIFGLGEVNSKDMTLISNGLGKDYMCFSFNNTYGRTRFDLGIIIKRSAVLDVKIEDQVHYDEGRTYILAVKIEVEIDGTAVTIFLSHWPSRLRMQESDPNRCVYAYELRRLIQPILGHDKNASVILVGDYNDEPFDKSLSFHLKASRDRRKVIANSTFLYNPFWRRLGGHTAFQNRMPANWAAGTYYYSGGRETKWHTFDQFMFSRSFLRHGSWRLVEEEVAIVVPYGFLDVVRSRENRFDHLPIMSAMEK